MYLEKYHNQYNAAAAHSAQHLKLIRYVKKMFCSVEISLCTASPASSGSGSIKIKTKDPKLVCWDFN